MAARGQPWHLLRVSPSIALCTLRLPRRCPLAGSRPGKMASGERNPATTSVSTISKYVRPGGPGKGGGGRHGPVRRGCEAAVGGPPWGGAAARRGGGRAFFVPPPPPALLCTG